LAPSASLDTVAYVFLPVMRVLCAREAKQAMLRFHDYHLQKYEVSDHGKTAKLYLGFGYPGKETDFSEITFTEVAIYHFVHTAYSIITDIENVPISTLFENERDNLQNWNRHFGVDIWKDDIETTVNYLQSNNYSGWYIESAIGFSGFVVAKSVNGT
jgi:hypothetical protein